MTLVIATPNVAAASGVPPVPVPAPVAPVPVATGTTVTGGQVVGIVAAGLGAYDATCKTLEFLTGGWSDCGTSATEFVADKTGFGFIFGGSGDDRSGYSQQANGANGLTTNGITGLRRGTAAVQNYHGAAGGPFQVTFATGHPDQGGRLDRINVHYGSAANQCQVTQRTWSHYGFQITLGNGRTADAAALYAAAQANPITTGTAPPTTSGTGCSTLSEAAAPYRITMGSSTGFTVEVEWLADSALGTSWTLEYTLQCEKAGVVVEAVREVTFVPTPGLNTPMPELPDCEDVLPGSHPKGIDVSGGRDTVEGPANDVQVHYPAYNDDLVADYPLCTTHAPAGGCFLDLQRDGKTCFGPGGAYCAGWPQNITRWKMSCEWGPYALEMEMCLARYERIFDVVAPPNPNPKPTTPPVPPDPPAPCTSNCTTPPEPPVPPVDPENPQPPSGDSCLSDAWSLNPVDWVYVPMKCLFMWAFIPPAGTWENAMDRVTDPLSESMGPWNDAIVAGWNDVDVGGSGGCNGPGFSMPAVMQDGGMPATWYPVKACSGMASTVAGYSRMLATAGLVVLAVVKTISIIQSGLGLSSGVPIYNTGRAA